MPTLSVYLYSQCKYSQDYFGDVNAERPQSWMGNDKIYFEQYSAPHRIRELGMWNIDSSLATQYNDWLVIMCYPIVVWKMRL